MSEDDYEGYFEDQKAKEVIRKIASKIKFSEKLMEDLVINGFIVVRYDFDKETGELKTERVG